jgi:hypothetical protein
MGFDISFISAGRSFIYNKNNNGARIEPCGTNKNKLRGL